MGTRERVMVAPSPPGTASPSFICGRARQSTRPKHSRLLTCAGSLVQIREGHIGEGHIEGLGWMASDRISPAEARWA
jgi:hypothetical protein